MSIGAAAVRDGFDSQHGGIYETGLPGKGPVSTVKVSMLLCYQAVPPQGSWARHSAALPGHYSFQGMSSLVGRELCLPSPSQTVALASSACRLCILIPGPAQVWWVQAESMLALWKLHEHSQASDSRAAATAELEAGPDAGAGGGRDQSGQQGQSDCYLRVLQQTARFVRQYVTDGAGGGELFWEVQTDGTFKPTDKLERSTKGNMWKVGPWVPGNKAVWALLAVHADSCVRNSGLTCRALTGLLPAAVSKLVPAENMALSLLCMYPCAGELPQQQECAVPGAVDEQGRHLLRLQPADVCLCIFHLR
jgi:hypothetical protein